MSLEEFIEQINSECEYRHHGEYKYNKERNEGGEVTYRELWSVDSLTDKRDHCFVFNYTARWLCDSCREYMESFPTVAIQVELLTTRIEDIEEQCNQIESLTTRTEDIEEQCSQIESLTTRTEDIEEQCSQIELLTTRIENIEAQFTQIKSLITRIEKIEADILSGKESINLEL